jgi:hypothetical protein
MRFVAFFYFGLFCQLLAACGGEGKCAAPPCMIPDRQCSSNDDCFRSEFCNFAQNTCGSMVTDVGACKARPNTIDCANEVDAVCACDGKFYNSTCNAAAEGADVNAAGGCPPPAGKFACGPLACDILKQVCFDFVTDISEDASHRFQCQDFPEFCTNDRTCTCVGNFGCGAEQCKKDTGFTLTCVEAFPTD